MCSRVGRRWPLAAPVRDPANLIPPNYFLESVNGRPSELIGLRCVLLAAIHLHYARRPGRTSTRVSDFGGRLASVTNPMGASTRYEYNALNPRWRACATTAV